jgi:hypothetical protein
MPDGHARGAALTGRFFARAASSPEFPRTGVRCCRAERFESAANTERGGSFGGDQGQGTGCGSPGSECEDEGPLSTHGSVRRDPPPIYPPRPVFAADSNLSALQRLSPVRGNSGLEAARARNRPVSAAPLACLSGIPFIPRCSGDPRPDRTALAPQGERHWG